MPDILVRNLDADALDRLKAQARKHRRSLQAEAKLALERAAGAADVSAILNRWKKHFAGQSFAPSADLVREDRER